jgi:D-tyrosyl-tRNA(Tyr) deacylase
VRAVVQRVTSARVIVDDEVIGEIAEGLCVLVGVGQDDDEAAADKLADKVWGLRIMADQDGVMNRSVGETTGAVLVVSQFTLYGDTRKGRRPSFVAAARPEHAKPLVDRVVNAFVERGATVATGRFGADMAVELTNDGPVTLLLEV